MPDAKPLMILPDNVSFNESIVIKMVKGAGATVVIAAGSDEKCDDTKALGSDYATNGKSTDFMSKYKQIT